MTAKLIKACVVFGLIAWACMVVDLAVVEVLLRIHP